MPTYPGFNNNFDLNKYPPAVRLALRRIADNFYVTRSFDAVTVGNSTYYGALARPTDDTSVVLNTQRELLIVFSEYDTFEIRTLEAFDSFYSLVESSRVDKSIRFLVSNDSNIEFTIRHYLDQHPEYPIVIPCTFHQIQSRIDPLIQSVRSNYLIRDLFGFQSPLREEHFFFGRSGVVSAVLDCARSGQNSSLFGLRKSGKTSTIYAIERKSKPSEIRTYTVDCQDLAVHGRRYGDLLCWIVNKIRTNFSLKSLALPESLEGPTVAEWFDKSMRQTLDALGSNLLIIFDEIENISPRTAASLHWRTGLDSIYFWQVIRSFCQIQKKRSLTVCIVGTSPYILETAKYEGIDNPAYLLSAKRFIPNLTFEETKEMVERLGFFMGLNFPAQAIARLHDSYAGHPFFTRQVCSKVHQMTGGNRPCEVPISRVEEAQKQFSAQLDSYLSDIIRSLMDYYPEEFRLLRLMVLGDRAEVDEYLSEAPDLLDHLIGYGLIGSRDGIYELNFQALRRAVLRLEPEKGAEGNIERWAEVCTRRGQVEQDIRKNLLIWTKSITRSDWDATLEQSLTKSRFASIADSDPRVLLKAEDSPLYLSDLLMILKNNDVLPYLTPKRSIITDALNTVNKLRLDAHSNDISEGDFRKAVSALSLLEDEFAL